MWRYVSGYAENEMRKVIMKNEGRSITRKKDDEGRKKEDIKKEWEKGVEFTGKHQKSKAQQEVMNSLQFWSGKSIVRASVILSILVSK